MDFNQAVRYAEDYTSEGPEYLHQIERDTHLTTTAPQMISGRLQGRFLSLISRLIKPANILEIGTFTAYGTLCLAEGLSSEGRIHTIEADEELSGIIHRNIQMAGMEDRISVYIGDALQIIPSLDIQFDLVFIDAAKKDYSLFYDLVFEKVNSSGYILSDNVLWRGKVLAGATDEDTASLVSFNEKIQCDPRVENILLPLVDGMMVCLKK